KSGQFDSSNGYFAYTTITPSKYVKAKGAVSFSNMSWKIGSFVPAYQLSFKNNWKILIENFSVFLFIVILAAFGSWHVALTKVARLHAERKLKDTSETARLLENIAAAANMASHSETAMQAAIDLVCAHTGWPVGHVYIVHDNNIELHSTEIWHLADEHHYKPFKDGNAPLVFATYGGLLGKVFHSKKSAWITNICENSEFNRSKLAMESGLKSAFAFPVLVDNEVVCMLEFFSEDTIEGVPMLNEITAQIGTHIGSVVEREMTAKKLQKVTEEAEKANLYKSEFLASMSHELRTPLNAILGFAQLMQYDLRTPLMGSQGEYVDCILTGGNHLLELINEILDLAKIEADQMPLCFEDVDANEVVAECIALTIPLGEARGISIVDQFSSGQISMLRTDRLRFKQAIINLLSNAVKYNRDGGSVIITGQETPDDFLQLFVQDTGIGIADEDRNNVFEMFNRLDADTLIAQEGTGIGLTVTKLLIKNMAGSIGFDSTKDIGSTFWIKIPLTTNNTVMIWEDTFNTGIPDIDKDHQVLFSLVNDVTHSGLDRLEIDEVLNKLLNYTIYHFQREEAIMEACGYPDLKEHKQVHVKLANEAKELTETWKLHHDIKTIYKLQAFLRDWLTGHIKNTDSKIFEYAKDRPMEIHRALKKIE
ncbi:MAG: bacteriohemerythrin, partial [Magnetovibrio sp.]|nr:bacteriohemerythrin [Magnetovibrio sp.]